MKPAPLLKGYSYSPELIQEYKKTDKLLSLRIETNPNCNFNCAYCYATELRRDMPLLTYEKLTAVIDEAVELGIKSVLCIGNGEPLMYEHLKQLIQHVNSKGVTYATFSNLSLMTPELAEFFYKNGVTVIGKCDSLNEEVQDALCGKGNYKKIQKGLQYLLDAGYGKDTEPMRLGLGVVVCTKNLKEMPKLWRWMRKSNIFPNFERASLIGSAKLNGLEEITPEQTRQLNETLRKIDKEEFGFEWPAPYCQIPGHQCYLFYAGTHLDQYGGICPCPELPPIDYVYNKSLEKILHSEKYKKIRNVDKYMEGGCKGCQYLNTCHGCRSKAYIACGSFFGEDPFCPIAAENRKLVND